VNAISEAFRPGDIVRLHALAGSTNDVDDDAFLARRHQRIESPGHVDIAETFRSQAARQRASSIGNIPARDCTRVSDEQIGLGTFRGQNVDALAVGEIERKTAHRDIVLRGDLGFGRIEIGGGPRHHYDVTALLGQDLGTSAADAARRAGDKRLASSQPELHRVLPAKTAGYLTRSCSRSIRACYGIGGAVASLEWRRSGGRRHDRFRPGI
jgi:hypothetical protein